MPDIEKMEAGEEEFESPTVTDNTETPKAPAKESGTTAKESGTGEGTAAEIDPDSPLAFLFEDDDSSATRSKFADEYAAAMRTTEQLVETVAQQAAPLGKEEKTYLDKVRAQLRETGLESMFDRAKVKAQLEGRAAQPTKPTQAAASAAASPAPPVAAQIAVPADAPPWLTEIVNQQNAKIAALEQKNNALVEEKRNERENRQRAQFDAAVSDPNGQFYVPPDMRELAYSQVLAARKSLKDANKHNTRLGDLLGTVAKQMPSLVQTGKGKAPAEKPTPAKPTPAQPRPKNTPSGAAAPPVVQPKKAGEGTKKPASTLAEAADNFRESAARIFPGGRR